MFIKLTLPWSGLAPDERPNHITSMPFYLMHLTVPAAFLMDTNPMDWVACIGLYFSRMFFVTGFFHRYLSHKTYKARRWVQAVWMFLSQTCAQKGGLWWASWHRAHHRQPDMPEDPHDSHKGLWYSHVGWILCDKFNHTRWELVKQFTQKYPELKVINKLWVLSPIALGVTMFLWGGWSRLVVGFGLSTVFLYHGTFLINSFAHIQFLGSKAPHKGKLVGKSQNNFILALLTMGEGWHNTHHYRANVTKQGDKWWQFDPTYYILWMISMVRVPWLRFQEGRMTGLRMIPVFIWDVTRHPRQKQNFNPA